MQKRSASQRAQAKVKPGKVLKSVSQKSASSTLSVFDKARWAAVEPRVRGQTSGNAVYLNEANVMEVQALMSSTKSLSSTHKPDALVRRAISYKIDTALNKGLSVLRNGVEDTNTERNRKLLDIAGWAIEQREIYGFMVCRVVRVGSKLNIHFLQPKTDYTLVYDKDPQKTWQWEVEFPDAQKIIGKVLLFMPEDTAPDRDSGTLKSNTFTALRHIYRVNQLDEQCAQANFYKANPKSFLKLSEGSDVWKESVMMLGSKNVEENEDATFEEVTARVKKALQGITAFVKTVTPESEVSTLVPLLPNMEVADAPQATKPENADQERKTHMQMILTIFNIPYYTFFTEDAQYTMGAYHIVEKIGDNMIKNLQNELTRFLSEVYAMLYLDELSEDLDNNFIPSRGGGKPLTEEELVAIQNQYTVEIAFNSNPHLDFDTLVRLRELHVLKKEMFKVLALKSVDLPLEFMADSDEESSDSEQPAKKQKTKTKSSGDTSGKERSPAEETRLAQQRERRADRDEAKKD